MAITFPRMKTATKYRSNRWSIIFGALPISFLVVFFICPVAAIVIRGLDDPQGQFSPLKVLDVLHDPEFVRITFFTIGQAIASTFLTLLIGLPIAWLLARMDIPGRFLLRIVITVPFVLPTVVVGIIFRTLLAPNGFLGALGLDKTLWAILLAHVFFNVSIVARTVGGMWSHLDPRAEQAARSLGASPLRTFYTVTLPSLAPAIFSAASVVFLFCATSFGVVLMLGGTRYRTLETEIYLQTVNYFDLQTAAALSLLQCGAVVLALFVATKARANKENSVLRSASSATATKPRGTGWAPVFAVLILIAVLLVFPLVMMVVKSLQDPSGQGWSLRAYQLLFDPSVSTGPARKLSEAFFTSLETATDASILAMIMGSLAAISLSRSHGRWSKVIDAVMMLPLGVSAVTVGFGFLLTLAVFPVELRTSPLLVPVVQALVATPLVIRIVLPTLQAIDPRLRESATTLGASPFRVWFSVDLPMALRSFAAAAGFAYVIALGEFGATSFLTRPDSPTLPVLIGQLITRPGGENASAAMGGATILLVVTIAAVSVIECARIGELGEF